MSGIYSNQNVPKVSVIIATYQRDAQLERAVLSVINQRYSNFEVIVVSDNADIFWNNEVKRIINKVNLSYKDTVIKIFYNEKNIGPAKTRNVGIEHSTGEYVTFLDDDDIYLPNKILRQVIPMKESGTDFSVTNLDLYNEDGRFLERRRRKSIDKYINENKLLDYHLTHHLTGTDTIMFKREYLLEIGCFGEIDFGDEFYLMEKAIVNKGKFIYINSTEVIATVYYNSNNLSSGLQKIKGEKSLFEYKKKYFKNLSRKDLNYIKARHHAVIAYAYLRMKKYFGFIINSSRAFCISPVASIKIFKER